MTSKVLCIYLPQYHEIPENNEWWGRGFTEWTNVKRGKSYYPGHYQPREPLHENYYDLSNLKVLEKHTRMAKKAGISGFCFYHYYFKGKTLLEKPIEKYRDYSSENFPYCLIWANQSWERTWYRGDSTNKVLMRQSYGDEEDWKQHFLYLLPFFKDKRYIKVHNKPIFIIYLPQEIHCRRAMYKLWNEMARDNGFSGIYLIAMNTWAGGDELSRLYDAYVDFEPLNSLREDNTFLKIIQLWKRNNSLSIDINNKNLTNYIFTQNTYSYTFLCKAIEKNVQKKSIKTYPGTFSGWDNTARKDESGIVVRGSNPQKFEKHIRRLLRLAEKNRKEFIFLNAWNEWSEGAYIEPDKKYGYGYLNALKRAIYKYENAKEKI